MNYVESEAGKVAYTVHGRGEPLVLVHGWSNEGCYWCELGYVESLSAEFQVIVPDLRGHGHSDASAECDYGDEAFAADITAVLGDLDIDSAHMFGYSLGGWVVLELLASSPGRVRSAIIGGAHPYAEDLSPLRVFAPAEIALAWQSLGASLSENTLARLRAMDHQVLIDMAEDRVDESDRLQELPAPCLLICGTEDWRYEGMRRFSRRHRRAKLVSIDGADHLQAWLQRDTVLDAVLAFLRG